MFTTTGCVFYTTGETEVGVRTRKFSLTGKGLEDKAYAPGSTYIFLPFINDWHTFDTKLQNLEMVFEQARGIAAAVTICFLRPSMATTSAWT